VAVSGSHAYVADRYGRSRVIDVSDPASLFEVGVFGVGYSHEAVVVNGNYAYVLDVFTFPPYLYLRVIDVSTPSEPIEVGSLQFDWPGWGEGMAVSGSYAYIGDYWDGFRVVDVSDPESPLQVGFVDIPDHANGVAISGGLGYVANCDAGLRVIDVSDPASPFEVGFSDTPGEAQGVAVSGGFVYVADWDAGLQIFRECAMFADGFESGDTSAWSSTVP
jgi:hypothetical protein